MKLYEIDLNWANKQNAQNPRNFGDRNYVLLNCNIEDVFNNGSGDFKLDPHDNLGGKNGIGQRAPNAKAHFQSGGAMDPPEVGYNPYQKTVDFTNGRHRAVAAFQLGHEYIPMFVSTSNIDKFKQIIRTK